MVLTPTYHVFEMYTPFQEATYLPIDLESEVVQCSTEYFKQKANTADNTTRPCPLLSASAAKTQDGSLVLAITNVSLDKDQTIDFDIPGYKAKTVSGRILTSKQASDFNDFQHPNVVAPKEFKDAKLAKNVLTVKIQVILLQLANKIIIHNDVRAGHSSQCEHHDVNRGLAGQIVGDRQLDTCYRSLYPDGCVDSQRHRARNSTC